MRRWFIFAMCMALTACSDSGVPGDGFGDIKYGMSSEEVENLGFKCILDRCFGDELQLSEVVPKAGKMAKIEVDLVDGKAASITAISLLYSRDEMIKLYSEAYGAPETCRYSNGLAAVIERHVWSAKNGSTISISKILDRGITPNLSNLTGGSSTIEYRDSANSAKFKSDSC